MGSACGDEWTSALQIQTSTRLADVLGATHPRPMEVATPVGAEARSTTTTDDRRLALVAETVRTSMRKRSPPCFETE
jgi:hypothetical protein